MSTSDPMRQSKMLPMPVRQSTRLPPAFPQLSDTAVLGKDPAARKAALDGWQADVRAWWKTARFAMQQDYEELSQGANTSINKGNALDTALRTEVQARNDGDATLLTQIQSLVLSTGPNRIFAQSLAPATPQVNDLWFDTDDGFHPWYYDGAGWVDARDGAISGAVAAITTEETNRIAGDLAQSERTDAILNRIDDPETGIAAMATTLDSVTTQVSTVAGDVTAQGQRVSALEVSINGPNGDDGIAATVAEIEQSYVDADEAAALATQSIAASLTAGGAIKTALDEAVVAGSGNKTFRQSAAPTVGVAAGDLWTDSDDGKLYRYSGTEWVDISDSRMAEITTLSADVTTIKNAYVNSAGATAAANTAITASLNGTGAGTIGNKISTSITTEATARTNADVSLGSRCDDLESRVYTGPNHLTARVGTIESAYVTATTARAAAKEEIKASISGTASGTIGAAITTEREARAEADKFLSGKYTLAVDLGGVVTGMNVSATSWAGVTTSNIQFQADKFQIYNGTSGAAPFEVAGGVVYIKSAAIRDLSASVIKTGTLNAIAITGGTIRGTAITGVTIDSTSTITGAKISASLGITSESGQFDRLDVGPRAQIVDLDADVGFQCSATSLFRYGLNVGRSTDHSDQDGCPSGKIYARSLDISDMHIRVPTAGVPNPEENGPRIVARIVGSDPIKQASFRVYKDSFPTKYTEILDDTITATAITATTNVTALNGFLTNIQTSGFIYGYNAQASSPSHPACPHSMSIDLDGRVRAGSFWGRRCIGNVNAGTYLCATDSMTIPRSAVTETSQYYNHEYYSKLGYDSNSGNMVLSSKTTGGMYFENATGGDFWFKCAETRDANNVVTVPARMMRFGKYTIGGVGISIGYITIKDDTGVLRKLVVCA